MSVLRLCVVVVRMSVCVFVHRPLKDRNQKTRVEMADTAQSHVIVSLVFFVCVCCCRSSLAALARQSPSGPTAHGGPQWTALRGEAFRDTGSAEVRAEGRFL